MLITSGFNFEGFHITNYFGHGCAQVVLGTGFLSSLNSDFSDLFGTRSSSYEEKLHIAGDTAKQKLISKANECGANAIIGFDLDFTTFSRDIIGVIVGGTFVKIAENEDYSSNNIDSNPDTVCLLVNRIYDLELPIRINFLYMKKDMITNQIYLQVRGNVFKNVFTESRLQGVNAKISIKNIFNSSIDIDSIMFANIMTSENGLFQSETIRLEQQVNSSLRLFNHAFIYCNQIAINDEVLNPHNVNLYESQLSDLELLKNKKLLGDDIVALSEDLEQQWRCSCGVINILDSRSCIRCGRLHDLSKIIRKLETDYSFDFSTHMPIMKNMKNAKEIYDYLYSFTKADIFLQELQSIAKEYVEFERIYGNSKGDLIKKFDELTKLR